MTILRFAPWRRVVLWVAFVATSGRATQEAFGQTLTATRGSFTINADSVKQRKLDFHLQPLDATDQACVPASDLKSSPCVKRRRDSVAFVRGVVSDSLEVSIVADANLKSVVTNGPGTTNPASGALGVTVGEFEQNLTVLINVAGTSDTLKKNVGGALLPPTSGGLTTGQVSALIDFRKIFTDGGVGVHAYGSITPVVIEDTALGRSASAVVAAVGVQGTYEVYNQPVSGTAISILFDLGPALRALSGDAASTGNRQLRKDLLTTTAVNFWGAESGLTLFVKDVRVGVSAYYFGGSVPGMSHLQAVFGVSVSDAFISSRSLRSHKLGLGQ